MPASAIIPIIAVAVNMTGSGRRPPPSSPNPFINQKPGMMPIMVSGMDDMMISDSAVEAVCSRSTKKIADQRECKRQSHVAENPNSDSPFAFSGPHNIDALRHGPAVTGSGIEKVTASIPGACILTLGVTLVCVDVRNDFCWCSARNSAVT